MGPEQIITVGPNQVSTLKSRPDGTVVIEVDKCELPVWNHEPERMAEAAAASGGVVEYQPRWGLLWVPSNRGKYAFSVSGPFTDKVPCPDQLPAGSPVELLEGAGGFTISIDDLSG